MTAFRRTPTHPKTVGLHMLNSRYVNQTQLNINQNAKAPVLNWPYGLQRNVLAGSAWPNEDVSSSKTAIIWPQLFLPTIPFLRANPNLARKMCNKPTGCILWKREYEIDVFTTCRLCICHPNMSELDARRHGFEVHACKLEISYEMHSCRALSVREGPAQITSRRDKLRP